MMLMMMVIMMQINKKLEMTWEDGHGHDDEDDNVVSVIVIL